jgi:hypothetical protein
MRRVIAVLFGMALGGGAVFGAFHYHLIRTNEGWLVVKRQKADWRDSYVDIRGWTYRDWPEHKALSHDLVAAGRGDLVARSMADQLFRGIFDPFREHSPPGSQPGTPRAR